MAKTLNKVQLIGRLGADPEMRVTSAGMSVVTFSIATNRQWQGKDGTLQEETDWHTIVAWDKLAQICAEHLSKGRLVYIEGRLRNRSWETAGQKFYKTEVVASDMLILDSKGATAPEPVPSERNGRPTAQAPVRTVPDSRSRVAVADEDDPDELPF